MRHKDIWTGHYRGIVYEVAKWQGGGGNDIWNYYIYIQMANVPKEHLAQFDAAADLITHYPALLERLEWHCGMTYVRRYVDHERNESCIQAGCDYNHLYDEGQVYSKEYLAHDARRTIDDLYEKAPWLLVWCRGCGSRTVPPEEAVFEDGQYTCPRCRAKQLVAKR